MIALADLAPYLAAIAGCLLLVGLLKGLQWSLRPLIAAIDAVIGLVQSIPFVGGHVAKLGPTINGIIQDGINALDNYLASLFYGLRQSIDDTLKYTGIALAGVAAALTWLYRHSLPGIINRDLAPVRAKADEALAKAGTAAGSGATNLAQAKAYADAVGARTLTAADAKATGIATAKVAQFARTVPTTIRTETAPFMSQLETLRRSFAGIDAKVVESAHRPDALRR